MQEASSSSWPRGIAIARSLRRSRNAAAQQEQQVKGSGRSAVVRTIALRLLQAYANLLFLQWHTFSRSSPRALLPARAFILPGFPLAMSIGARNFYCRGLVAQECYSSCLFARLPGFRLATLGVRIVLRRRKTGSRSPTLSGCRSRPPPPVARGSGSSGPIRPPGESSPPAGSGAVAGRAQGR